MSNFLSSKKKMSADEYILYLEKKYQELHSIFEISRHFNTSLSLDKTIDYILLTFIGQLNIESSAIFLLSSEEDNRLTVYASKGIPVESFTDIDFIIGCSPVLEQLKNLEKPLLLSDLSGAVEKSPEIRSLKDSGIHMLLKLQMNTKIIGILALGRKIDNNSDFSEDEINFIVSSTKLISSAAGNSLMYQQLQVYNESLEAEVERKTKFIEQRESYFKEMALLLPTIIIETDLRSRILFMNKTGFDTLGIKESERTSNLSLLNFIHPQEQNKFLDLIAQLKKNESIKCVELRLQKADLSSFTLLIQAVMIKDTIRWNAMNINPIMSSIIMPEDSFFQNHTFSEREKEVLILMIQGLKTKDMAKKLFRSESTIKSHIANIYNEMGVSSKEEFFDKMQDFQVSRYGYDSFVFYIINKIIQGKQDD